MIRSVVISVIFGAAGIAVTLWLLGENLNAVGRIPLSALLIGATLVVANYLSGALRLMLLVGTAATKLPFMVALRAYALGLFSAAATPGAAGQAPAVVLSLTRDGMPAAHAWSVNVYIWVLDLIFLAWSLPISLLVLGRTTRVLRIAYPEAWALVSALVAVFMVWVLLFRLHWLVVLLTHIFKAPGLRRWRDRVTSFGSRVHEASRLLRDVGIMNRLTLHALTGVIYLSTLVTFYVMVKALNPSAPLLPTLASAQVPMVLATFFPTPGGAGLLEIFTASVMLAGAPPLIGPPGPGELVLTPGEFVSPRSGTVAAAILGWRLLTFYSRLVIGPALGGASLRRKRDQTLVEGLKLGPAPEEPVAQDGSSA